MLSQGYRLYLSRSSAIRNTHVDYRTTTTIVVGFCSIGGAFFASQHMAKLEDSEENEECYGIVETDLMDKIAQKPYLRLEEDVNSQRKNRNSTTRNPVGVPEVLRLMLIDVPEFKKVFDEKCVVDPKLIFADGVANNKICESQKKERLEIVQKSLIQSLSKCGKKEKTLLLEASIANLNPRNMKRRYKFNRFSDNIKNSENKPESNEKESSGDSEDEEFAPWNQSAWFEEMDLRINGKVEFDAPLEKSSVLQNLIFGNYYKVTVPKSPSFWKRYLLYPISYISSNTEYLYYPDGVDFSHNHNRASNKPHAVIANGKTMHSVSGSLLHLSKLCKEANVPLFIINDPRSWGHNTHFSIKTAAQDLRKTIKKKIVRQALKIQQGDLFQRGRAWGISETKAKHQIQQVGENTRRAIMRARKSLVRSHGTEMEDNNNNNKDEERQNQSSIDASQQQQKDVDTREEEDWGILSLKELKNRLIQKRLIQETKNEQRGGEQEQESNLTSTSEMLELCKLLIDSNKKNKPQ